MSDEYLWDKSGSPDPEIERLEQALAPLRFKPPPAETIAPIVPIAAARRARRRIGGWVLLAAAAAMAAGWVIAARPSPGRSRRAGRRRSSRISPPAVPATPPEKRVAFAVERVAGTPRVGSAAIGATGELAVGEWIETDPGSRARITVAEIGQVDVAASTRVRLTATGPAQHRLDLARGSISARVDAPPRLFVVGTPAATAVDLGCAYTLDVDDSGAGSLRVTSGWVSLEDPERSALVAAGATCHTRPGRGPGTPSFDDAPAALREALARFDFEAGGEPAVSIALAKARARDALSIWHLLARVEEPLRKTVFERLRRLAPPPKGVGEPEVMRLDRAALERWRDHLAKREVPITW